MDQFTVDAAARIFALQSVVRLVGKIACIAAGFQPEDVTAMAEQARQQLENATFPGNNNPALADHFAAEFAKYVDQLLSGIASDVTEAYASGQK
jgi:hypothetical protein